jgi:cytochrome P450 family 6
MYSPAPALTRVCLKKYTIPDTGVTIDKGTLISVPINVIHSNPLNFKNPAEFCPERFSSSETFDRKFIYMPFGEGPRQCIGKNFP